jgi:hypothetical protein
MTKADAACKAMEEWWRGVGGWPSESISVPYSQDVVSQFLLREPMLQIHEAPLREWARGEAWTISSAGWDAICIRNKT